MMMELDEMKQVWQVLDRRLAEQATLYRAIHRGQGMDRLRRGLRPLVWGQSVQIAFGVFFLLLGIDFWVTHMGTLRTIVWGTSVQAFGVLMIASAGRILHLVQQIDYAVPVVDIQRRLARLRAWRVRVEAPVFAAVGAVIWVPLVLIWIQLDWDRLGSHGPDFWEQTPYLLPHFLISAFVSLALVMGAYVLLLRLGRSRWLQDNFAGSAVRRAEAALAEVASFEQE